MKTRNWKTQSLRMLAGLWIAGAATVSAADKSWTGNANLDWNSANWSPAGTPSSTDNVWFTNAITGNRTVSNLTVSSFSVNDLTISNSVAFTQTLLVSNQLFAVNGTATLGSNGVLAILGSGTTLATTAMVNNLRMESGSAISFIHPGAQNTASPDSLIVTGAFVNSANSIIRTIAASSLSSFRLQFENATVITNNGTISGRLSAGSGGAVIITVVNGTQTNTFLNAGTIQFGSSANPRTYTFNSMLVNQGFLSISNTPVSGSGDVTVNIAGKVGTAVTNDTTGIWEFYGKGAASGPFATIENILNGGFVNKGILRSLLEPNAGTGTRTNIIALSAGNTFANAAGGQLILGAANSNGNLRIRADTILNQGTNLVDGGRLIYHNAGGSNGVLQNSGWIGGQGTLVVNTLSNLAGGTVLMPSGAGSILGSSFVNSGGSLYATNNGAATLNVGINVSTNLRLNGGLVQADSLLVTNAGSTFAFSGGSLVTSNLQLSAGMTVGDGSSGATNTLGGGFARLGGNLVVTNQAVMNGNGTVATGNTVVTGGGTLAPGNSVGILNFSNNLSLAGGTYLVEYDALNSTSDFVNVFGTLDLTGGILSFTNINGIASAQTFVFGKYGTLLGGDLLAAINGLPTGATVDMNYLGQNELALIVNIPEPSALLAAAVGLALLPFLRRRRA